MIKTEHLECSCSSPEKIAIENKIQMIRRNNYVIFLGV